MFALKTNKKKKKNRKKAQTKKDKNFDRAAQGSGRNHLFSRCACVITIYFVLVCTRTYHRERNKILEMVPTLPQERVRNWQICAVPWHAWRYHMEKITRSLLYIYRNCYLLLIELSEWKGTVTCGQGSRFLSLTAWRQLSDTYLVKAITGPKFRGTSFGTALWHSVYWFLNCASAVSLELNSDLLDKKTCA